MQRRKGVIVAMLLVILASFSLTACDDRTDAEKNVDDIYAQVDQEAEERTSYIPKNDWDYVNYDRAWREVWDNPTSIQWCTFSFDNANSPLVTVPIQTKLTSSSVSIRPNQQVKIDNNTNGATYTPEVRSVDGMYHGSPPPYRYGFTPGGQYSDFFNLGTYCSTAPTKFQREKSEVSLTLDPELASADGDAEQALADGDEDAAQAILDDAIGGGK
jgi:hypothetical protein